MQERVCDVRVRQCVIIGGDILALTQNWCGLVLIHFYSTVRKDKQVPGHALCFSPCRSVLSCLSRAALHVHADETPACEWAAGAWVFESLSPVTIRGQTDGEVSDFSHRLVCLLRSSSLWFSNRQTKLTWRQTVKFTLYQTSEIKMEKSPVDFFLSISNCSCSHLLWLQGLLIGRIIGSLE